MWGKLNERERKELAKIMRNVKMEEIEYVTTYTINRLYFLVIQFKNEEEIKVYITEGLFNTLKFDDEYSVAELGFMGFSEQDIKKFADYDDYEYDYYEKKEANLSENQKEELEKILSNFKKEEVESVGKSTSDSIYSLRIRFKNEIELRIETSYSFRSLEYYDYDLAELGLE